jgi:hypothetical protein
MIRYIALAASMAVLASLAACITYREPVPQVGGPAADQGGQSKNAAYSSQLSVINRRAEHAKKGESSSSSSR